MIGTAYISDAHTLILCAFSRRETEGSRRKWAVAQLRETR